MREHNRTLLNAYEQPSGNTFVTGNAFQLSVAHAHTHGEDVSKALPPEKELPPDKLRFLENRRNVLTEVNGTLADLSRRCWGGVSGNNPDNLSGALPDFGL